MPTGSDEKLNKLVTYKERIRQAIVRKGVRCPKNTPYSLYYQKIDSIKKIEEPIITYEEDQDLPFLVDNWLTPANRNARYLYYNNSTMTELTQEELDNLYSMSLKESTDAYYAFGNCDNLRRVPELIELPKVTNANYLFYDSDNINFADTENRFSDITDLQIISSSEYATSNINTLVSDMTSYYYAGEIDSTAQTLNAYIISAEEYDSENNTITFRMGDSSSASSYLIVRDYPCTQEFAESLTTGTIISITGKCDKHITRQTVIEVAPGCNLQYAFYYCRYMRSTPKIVLSSPSNTNNYPYQMYSYCYYLDGFEGLKESEINISDANYLFFSSYPFVDGKAIQNAIDALDLSKITSMQYCFACHNNYGSLRNYSKQDKHYDVTLMFPDNHVNNKNVNLSYMFSNQYNSYGSYRHHWDAFRTNTYGSCSYLFYEYAWSYDPISNPSYYNLRDVELLEVPYTTSLQGAFSWCGNLQYVTQITTGPRLTNTESMFYYCRRLETVPGFDTSNVTNMNQMFYYCSELREVGELDMSNCSSLSNMFYNCTSLERLQIRNLKYNLNISYSNRFTRQALVEIINNLYDWSGTSTYRTLTIGSDNKAKLLEEDIAIATAKNWTLA